MQHLHPLSPHLPPCVRHLHAMHVASSAEADPGKTALKQLLGAPCVTEPFGPFEKFQGSVMLSVSTIAPLDAQKLSAEAFAPPISTQT